MRWRTFLASVGAVVGALCLSGVSRYDPATLRSVLIADNHDATKTLEVRVVAADEVALHDAYDLDAFEARTPPCRRSMPAEEYRCQARLDGEHDWTEAVTEGGGDACRSIEIMGEDILANRFECDASTYDRYGVEPCSIPWWVEEVRYG